MRNIYLILALCFVMGGCAWFTQAKQDYNTGATTPVLINEVSPAQEANAIASTASAIPFAAPFAGILAIVLTGFFTWQRGVAIRKTGAPTASANVNIFTAIIQDVANIFAGAFTTTTGTSTAGTVWQRVWKVALATVASGTAIAAANPSLQAYLTAHPVLSTVFVAVTSGIAGIEKAMSNVPVVTTVVP